MTPAELKLQVQQHLYSLKLAGVRYLPMPGSEITAISAPATSSKPSPVTSPAPPKEMLFVSMPAAPVTTVAPVASAEVRQQELTMLAQTVAGCTRCKELASRRTQTVFGVGPLSPEICFVGEGPGATEDQKGEPFVGDAGQLLNKIITAACGMKREEVYICNIVKCRPPGNRVPLPDEASNCREYLLRQLELVAPKYICALGACAAQNLLDTKDTIGRLRGRFHQFRGIPVLCTYHPAYLLRSPEKKRDVWEDIKMLLARMGRPVPAK